MPEIYYNITNKYKQVSYVVGKDYLMVSRAKQEASMRYNKLNVRRVTVIFLPLDRDIQEYLESKESMGGYLKKLLREDFNRSQNDSHESAG